MGLKVNKKTYSRSHGFQDSLYCRLERVMYKKIDGTIAYTLQFYTSKEDMDNMYPTYFGDEPMISSVVIPYTSYFVVESGSVSGSTILDIDDDGEEIHGQKFELPLYNSHFLTASVDVTIPVYEMKDVYETITYTDYDDEGNLVEKERQEYSGSVKEKVEDKIVTKTRLLHEKISSGSVYSVGYEYVKKDLEEFFGSGSVEDVI